MPPKPRPQTVTRIVSRVSHRTHLTSLMVETTLMQESARAGSGARENWQACTMHTFLFDHRTSCTVFRAMVGLVVFAMTTMVRLFTTHLISFVVHQIRFRPDSLKSGPNLGTGLT